MKRLLTLAVLTLVSVALAGCGFFNRGSACNTCPTPGPGYGDAYMGAPAAVGPGTYLPGPGPN